MKKKIGALTGILLAIIISCLTPPQGLTPAAMRGIGIICGAIIFFIFDPIPSYLITMLMCSCFVIFGVAKFPQAFSAYAGTTWWLIIGALGIGVAVNKCGLLKRLSLYVMKLFPPTFSGMVFALLSVGTLFAPLMPSTSAKQTIVAPLTIGIGETLGLKKRSKGMAGLFNAMYIGWSINGTVSLSASFVGYMLLGALPETARASISWTSWFIGMIPYGIVLIVCSYFMLNWIYKPADSGRVPAEFIDQQIKDLGPMTRNEKLVSLIFAITLCFWITEGIHKIPAALTAILCLVAMGSLKLFVVPDFHAKMIWSLIFYIGGIMNIGTIITIQKIDVWLGNVAGPTLGSLASSPYIFVFTVAVTIYLMRFVMVSFASLMIIVTIILAPIAAEAGFHPWATGMIAYCSVCTWLTLYQNANMLVGWASAGGEENLDFNHVRPGAYGYLVINIIGLLISVPWWKMLGYIK